MAQHKNVLAWECAAERDFRFALPMRYQTDFPHQHRTHEQLTMTDL